MSQLGGFPTQGIAQECSKGDSHDLLSHISHAGSQCSSACAALKSLPPHMMQSSSGELLRDVSLTIATVDRLLSRFFKDLLDKAATAGHTVPNSAARTHTGHALSLARLEGELRELERNKKALQRFLPPGGLVSVLHHISVGLDEVSSALQQFQHRNSVLWRARALKTLRGMLPVLVSVAAYRWLRRIPSIRKNTLLRYLLSWLLGFLCRSGVTAASRRLSSEQQLRSAHRHLLLLLRTWLVAEQLFEEANSSKLRSSRSYASIVRDPHDKDYQDEHKTSAQLLLESTSIPQEAAMWFKRNRTLRVVKFGLDVLYSSLHAGYSDGQITIWKSLPWFPYYALQPALAADTCASLLREADVHFVKLVWRLADSYGSRVLLLLLPRLATMKSVSIAGVDCHAFFTKKLPGDFFGLMSPGEAHTTADETGPNCLLYIHGGGFVGSSFASDARLITDWALQTNALIVFVHYQLSPEVRYPVALDECVAVYRNLRTRCRKVAVFGESAGGNLAAAAVLKVARLGLPKPDGLVLAYPALNLNATPSPSRFFHLSDPLVPTATLLPSLAKCYVPVGTYGKALSDPLLCPLFAGHDEMVKLPPVYISCAGCDPLLDDAVEFNTKIRRAGVPGDLRVFRSLPHGFFMLSHLSDEAKVAIRQNMVWIQAVLA